MLLPTEHSGNMNKKSVVMIAPLKYLGSIGTWSLKKKIEGGGYMFIRIIYILKIKTIASISMYPLLCLFNLLLLSFMYWHLLIVHVTDKTLEECLINLYIIVAS